METDNLHRGDIEIISGMASSGADYFSVLYAEANKFPLKEFWAKWDDVDAPGAKIRQDSSGRNYNANAGFDRNTEMASYAQRNFTKGILIAFWDGRSKGTEHMISVAKAHGLVVITVILDQRQKEASSEFARGTPTSKGGYMSKDYRRSAANV